jgi:hypothetical protein
VLKDFVYKGSEVQSTSVPRISVFVTVHIVIFILEPTLAEGFTLGITYGITKHHITSG